MYDPKYIVDCIKNNHILLGHESNIMRIFLNNQITSLESPILGLIKSLLLLKSVSIIDNLYIFHFACLEWIISEVVWKDFIRMLQIDLGHSNKVESCILLNDP